uniref:Uncharacterized protein n=1 Tax=Oryza sativa subsp. japonica TaxID=39947 RepID=Q5VPA3_ORYSJ|nr:hypothetical protein [Oryza sativa Japonica Group]BAD68722.1 hypothetical protein [Oryza sativa Japonica Group]
MPGAILGLVATATIPGAAFAVAAAPPTPPPQAPATSAPAPRCVQVQAPWMDYGDAHRRAVLPPTGDGVAAGTVSRSPLGLPATFRTVHVAPRAARSRTEWGGGGDSVRTRLASYSDEERGPSA